MDGAQIDLSAVNEIFRQPGYPGDLQLQIHERPPLAHGQREETNFWFLSGPAAFPACSLTGTVGPSGSKGQNRRPTITRGLALSTRSDFPLAYLLSNFNAKQVLTI